MEQEIQTVEHDFKAVQEAFGDNVFNLTLAGSYVKKLLLNAKVIRFLTSRHPDIFSAFEDVAAMEML